MRAVITDTDGHLVAEGRNHVYDPPGGPDALQARRWRTQR
jgi:hypothetical protein